MNAIALEKSITHAWPYSCVADCALVVQILQDLGKPIRTRCTQAVFGGALAQARETDLAWRQTSRHTDAFGLHRQAPELLGCVLESDAKLSQLVQWVAAWMR